VSAYLPVQICRLVAKHYHRVCVFAFSFNSFFLSFFLAASTYLVLFTVSPPPLSSIHDSIEPNAFRKREMDMIGMHGAVLKATRINAELYFYLRKWFSPIRAAAAASSAEAMHYHSDRTDYFQNR